MSEILDGQPAPILELRILRRQVQHNLHDGLRVVNVDVLQWRRDDGRGWQDVPIVLFYPAED